MHCCVHKYIYIYPLEMMIMLAALGVQMMCKGVMHLFWAARALYKPNKEVSEAVCLRNKNER